MSQLGDGGDDLVRDVLGAGENLEAEAKRFKTWVKKSKQNHLQTILILPVAFQ